MEDLTEKQKKRLIQLAQVLDEGDIALLKYIHDLEDRLPSIDESSGMMSIPGPKGTDGKDGKNGTNGRDGSNGRDGYTPRKGVDYFDGKDGRNGKDGKNGRDGIDGKNGKDGSPDNGEEIIKKINGSKSFIKRSRIEGLDKELKAIRNIPRGGGGGTSALAVAKAFKYIFHTEQPTGSINGSNTTYTVKNDIWAIISFSLNGETIAQLPNFTFVNKTITFSSALPAAYSGKDFEVKYIG